MFSKKEAGPTVEHSTVSERPRSQPHQQMPSIISEGVEIVGDMIGETEIQVDGSVRGNLKAKRVMIGRTGLVDGSIKAETIIIAGNVSGDTNAKNITLEASARIKGGVNVSGDLSMAAGARLEGKVTMKQGGMSDKDDADEKEAAAKPSGNGSRPTGMPAGNKPGGSETGIGRPAA
ncbi:MAG TPA: polymer-forming cytoskeletal protein [Alphaproteobacteria bacterium]|nr:polymer-forming cytoskeletal protein [Alphaproteobacteria bacterium]